MAGAEGGRLQFRLSDERGDQLRHLLRLIGREPFQSRCWAELGYFLVSAGVAYFAAVTLTAFGAAGLLLSVVFVGVLILAGGLRAARGYGRWQRGLARRVLGEDIPEPVPFESSPGFFRWLRAAFSDPTAWRSLGYFVAKVPLTIFGIWFAFGIWVEALSGIITPLTGHTGPLRFGAFSGLFSYRVGGPQFGFAGKFGVFVTGVLLLFVAPWTMRIVVTLDKWLMHMLLGPDALTMRVQSLEQSRSKTLEGATETLQRIERDLHDGTQAQLVALAMRLGQAKDKLDNLDPSSGDGGDLDAIRRLVDEAHSGAKEAIIELRDLARGIHPPALDTGLENALATLAARSSVPTEVTVSIEFRPTPSIETICYFCAAELLANVAQHAAASRASLSCAEHGPWLRLVVRDDGHGGAAINRVGSSSSGLAGLADRVGAVDGHLSVASPPGGPTVVTVDLPTHA
jgi:signal transduction histidine kinase